MLLRSPLTPLKKVGIKYKVSLRKGDLEGSEVANQTSQISSESEPEQRSGKKKNRNRNK